MNTTGENSPALEMDHVARHFGQRTVVNDLSLRLERGQVVALLGPNGAGKTTTVRMASTLLTPHAGHIWVAGTDAQRHPRRARAQTGLVLGGDRGFYMRASALENLRFFADVAGVPGRKRESRVAQALQSVGLDERASDKVGAFSRGMVQRLHLARALVADPVLLLLDEPTNGLDVEAARDVREIIRSVTNRGCGVLLTTHVMAEAEVLSDRIDVIQQGKIIVSGEASHVAHAAGVTAVSMFVSAGDVPYPVLENLKAVPSVKTIDVARLHGRTTVAVVWGDTVRTDLLEPWAQGVNVTTRPPTLEESYLALMDAQR